MPTGAGKSVCYQLPALLFPGITLVVSPLIALMKDQVMALKQSGVAAAYINSSLTPGQQQEAIRRAKNGAYKIIYVAPERLQTPAFLDFATHAPISLLAVDEAHCVSQWGQDFRPSYLKVPDFVRALPHRPPVAAFTATATQQVRRDMIRLLELEEPYTLVTGYNRPNLRFVSVKPTSRPGYLLRYLEEADPDACGIVYCSTRKNVEDVCERLRQGGFSATRYHAGLTDEERYQLLLENMRGQMPRTAKFVSVITCCFPNGDVLTARGECPGTIAFVPMGNDGFGYNPVFFVPEKKKTFAQMTLEERSSISHRGKAMREFYGKLEEYLKK